MDDLFNIYVDRLRQGAVENIDRILQSDFLGINEPDLSYQPDISVSGEVYIAGEGLVFHLDIEAVGLIPCSICNEPVETLIFIKGLYHVEPLEGIRSGVFNMAELIRENILSRTPSFVECNEGKCPKRKEIAKYLKEEGSSQDVDIQDDGYHPFSELK